MHSFMTTKRSSETTGLGGEGSRGKTVFRDPLAAKVRRSGTLAARVNEVQYDRGRALHGVSDRCRIARNSSAGIIPTTRCTTGRAQAALPRRTRCWQQPLQCSRWVPYGGKGNKAVSRKLFDLNNTLLYTGSGSFCASHTRLKHEMR